MQLEAKPLVLMVPTSVLQYSAPDRLAHPALKIVTLMWITILSTCAMRRTDYLCPTKNHRQSGAMNKSMNEDCNENTKTGEVANDQHNNTHQPCEGKHDETPPISKEGQACLSRLIRQEPNWPRPGINFYDLSPAFADPEGLNIIISALIYRYKNASVTHVAGIDARGFPIGCARMYQLYPLHHFLVLRAITKIYTVVLP